MGLITQNNTGTMANANGYIDIAYADAYFLSLNKDDADWADLDIEVKEAAIISATSHIDNSNMGNFKGNRLTEAQVTQFPRTGLADFDGYVVSGVPELLMRATAEYAIRASVEVLTPDPTYEDSGMPIKQKKEKVGPIEESTTYQDNVFQPVTIRAYPEADMLLKQYLFAANYVVRG